ncbi:MAG: hypothetical protein ACLF0G_15770 [Candidatus Brocadiia bacterium]
MRATSLLVGALVALGCFHAATAASRFKVGDLATVTRDRTPLRFGRKVLEYLPKGKQVRIRDLKGGFALVRFPEGNEWKEGYVSLANLEPPEREDSGKGAIYKPGYVVVTKRKAKLKLGKKTLGTLAKGTRLTIRKVQGKWLGVYATIEDEKTWGWVHADYVTYASDQKPDDEEDTDSEEKGKDHRQEKEPKEGK